MYVNAMLFINNMYSYLRKFGLITFCVRHLTYQLSSAILIQKPTWSISNVLQKKMWWMLVVENWKGFIIQ